MNRISKIAIKGFKTLNDVEFEPGNLNVMIGPNGVGKSNFISFFRMLNWMLGSSKLEEHVAKQGGASKLLHDGADVTQQIETYIRIESEGGGNDYKFRLAYAAGDTLVFVEEKYRYSRSDYDEPHPWNDLGVGHKESRMVDRANSDNIAKYLLNLLWQCKVFQFHNTSATARIKEKWHISNFQYLKEDAANLGPFLYNLKENEPDSYRKIVETLRLILPFFDDFYLEPAYDNFLLSWREKNSDVIFDASQASDGMLRIFSLVTLLGQPVNTIPEILIIDEPELGLHPFAISLISDMIKSVSKHVQVIIATQSVTFVDQFEPEDVIVVERNRRETEFNRLNTEGLKEWIGEYSLGDLWLMNRIGGRP